MGITFQETEFVVSQDTTTAALEQTSVNYARQLQDRANREDFERRVVQSGIRESSGAFLEERFRG